MTDWRDRLDGLSRGHRIKALLAFELASDRASGEPFDVAADTLRAVARAEGLDTGQEWIRVAALDIAGCPVDGPAHAVGDAAVPDEPERSAVSVTRSLSPVGKDVPTSARSYR